MLRFQTSLLAFIDSDYAPTDKRYPYVHNVVMFAPNVHRLHLKSVNTGTLGAKLRYGNFFGLWGLVLSKNIHLLIPSLLFSTAGMPFPAPLSRTQEAASGIPKARPILPGISAPSRAP